MQLRFWAATDTGQVRDHNEDNFLVDQNLQLFVVCDGMGGHAAGEVASAICVRTVREVVAAEQALLEEVTDNPGEGVQQERVEQLMRRAVTAANGRIFQMAQEDSTRHGMGTTCVAQLIVGHRLFVGHVGDSRIYRIRNGDVEQVTDDHSLLNEMKRQGQVPEEMTEGEFPHNNAVTRAVGVRAAVKVDAFHVEIEAGDRLVMCSDGLSEYLEGGEETLSLMSQGNPEEVSRKCIEFANQSGGKDNITVIVVDCDPPVQTVSEGTAVERTDVIKILEKTDYFRYLKPSELEIVRRSSQRLEVRADEDIIADGQDNQSLFLILRGSVSLQLDREQVSVLTTGEHFGEMALIDAQDEQDENMVVKSLEPSVLLAIGRDQFLQLIREEPGLAIKLLWNFVQVFAGRLQSVPPALRFMPDEWRSEPEAVADVTPPSGTLVFEEDFDRDEVLGKVGAETPSVTVAQTPELPDLPPIESVRGSRDATPASSGDGMDDTLESAPCRSQAQTMRGEAMDRELLMEPEGDGPSVQINSPDAFKPRLEIGKENRERGFDRDEATAEFDEPDVEGTGPTQEPGEARASRDELARTMEIDWEGKPAPSAPANKPAEPPPAPTEGEGEDNAALRQTVSTETDGKKIGRPRGARTSRHELPAPSASILKKASRKVATPNKEKSTSHEGDQKATERRVAISGRVEVSDEEEEPETPEGPKIMVASDLMADGEEVD